MHVINLVSARLKTNRSIRSFILDIRYRGSKYSGSFPEKYRAAVKEIVKNNAPASTLLLVFSRATFALLMLTSMVLIDY